MASSPVTAPTLEDSSPAPPAPAASTSTSGAAPPPRAVDPPPPPPPPPPPESPPPPVLSPPPPTSPPPPAPVADSPPEKSPDTSSPPTPSDNQNDSSKKSPSKSPKQDKGNNHDDKNGRSNGNNNENDEEDDNGNGSDKSRSSSSSSSSSSKSSPSKSVPVPPSSGSDSSSSSRTPRLQPRSSGKDDRESKSSSGDNGLNMPAIIGIAVGVGLFLVALAVVACVCCAKNKKKKRNNSLQYYDASRKGSSYNNNGPPQKWQNGQDHVVKLPPPPGAAAGGGWQPQGPPPPIMLSSEMSSGFSGPHGPPLPPPSPSIALGFNKSTFSCDELAAATSGFSQANLLGQGGFGYVHKGVLPTGKEVAVKQLKSGSGQGEREFQAEVEIISRVHHRHLVSLVGYCMTGTQRMLVYEYVPNKTLEYHLHGKGQPVMDWSTRLKIALGSAKGLAYLHEDCHPRIIHRDIKSANILLDYKFEAMVADFGLAKLSSDNYTHVSTRVMGTFGYLAPEYASSGKLTEKSDVFSFGIMLLELLTGRRPVDTSNTAMEDSLVDWARPIMTRALADGNFEELVDPRMEGNFNTMEMTRVVACAAASVRHSARRRPKMSQIVRALEGDTSLDDLSDGVKPGQSSYFGSGSDYDSGSYASNMNRFRKVAFESNAYSGDYSGGLTSEYGLNASSSSSEAFSGDVGPPPHHHRPPPAL